MYSEIRFSTARLRIKDILCGGISLRRNALALLLSRSPKGVPMGDFFEGERFDLVVKQVPKGSA